MQVFWIIFFAFIAVIAFFVVAVIAFFGIAIKAQPRRKNTDLPPNASRVKYKHKIDEFRNWYFSKNIEYDYIKSFDGLKLCTQILEHKNSKKTVIMMHGFRAQDHDDFCGSVKYFYEDGFNIILPYQRGHDKSEGSYLTYGAKESSDCKKWTEYAVHRYGKDSKIVLYGVSMGCATVLLSLVKSLPHNVKCCIADCGYSSVKDIFCYVMGSKYHLPNFPMIKFVEFVCDKYAKFKFSDASPKDALKKNKIPVLFIHGKKDKFVPYDMGLENYNACAAPKEMITVKEATHAISFLVEPENVWEKARKFIYKYL